MRKKQWSITSAGVGLVPILRKITSFENLIFVDYFPFVVHIPAAYTLITLHYSEPMDKGILVYIGFKQPIKFVLSSLLTNLFHKQLIFLHK